MSKVLLVRVDGIGDALACAPLVAALREAGHEIGALFSTRNAEAFAPHTFARVHAVERIPWPLHGTTRASRHDALAEVRAVGYESALIASEEMDAYGFAWAAGIRRRVGFSNGWAKPFKSLRVRGLLTRVVTRPASAARSTEHEVETLFRLGTGLHGEQRPSCDAARLRPLVLDEPVAPDDRVVVQLSAKFAEAGLGAEMYGVMLRRLAAAGYRLLALGDDADFVARVALAAGACAEFASPQTTAHWKALLAGALMVVTPDSGAAHVAGMTGTSAVVLFAAGPSAEGEMRRWRPWAAPSIMLAIEGGPGTVAERVAEAAAQLAVVA